jgi:hypothetical protein
MGYCLSAGLAEDEDEGEWKASTRWTWLPVGCGRVAGEDGTGTAHVTNLVASLRTHPEANGPGFINICA